MLRLITLGALDLKDARGRTIHDVLSQPKRVALLLYLVMEGRRAPVSRDRLLALFWPESDETRARNALSQSLHQLRRSLGADVIENRGASAVQVRAEALWCDAGAFADAADRGDSDLALDLYRGDFCPGLNASGSADLEHWLDQERERLRRVALDAARTLARKAADSGDPAAAARNAHRALAMHPDDEEEIRSLLLLLECSGDATGALRAYDDFARRLRAELDADPEPGTVRLAEAIRARRGANVDTGPLPAVPVSSAPDTAVPALVPRPPRLGRLAAAAVVTLAVTGTVAGFWWRSGHGAEHSARTLAVIPFTVRAPSLNYLRDGMVDLLSTELDGMPGLKAVDPRSVIGSLGTDGSDPSGGARLSRRLGADYYIRGEALEVAGHLHLDASLVDAVNGEVVATASVVGDTTALFDLVDDLSGRILAGLSRGGDTTIARLAAVTTHSLPALKAFLRGEEALRNGNDAQAGAAFREAAELDTTFALAQYRLATIGTWVLVRGVEDPSVWSARAARNARRLTPLARDLLATYGTYRDLQMDETERRSRNLTEAYPASVEPWMMLGETWFHFGPVRGRSPMDAWAPFQRVLALEPGNSHAMIHLARLAAYDGRPATLDSLARRYFERYPDVGRGLEIRALQAYTRDDPAGRAAVVAAARRADDLVGVSTLEAAMLFAQDLDGARELARPLDRSVNHPVMRTIAARLIADLPLGEGRFAREPVQLFDSASEDEWRLNGQALVAGDPFFPVPPGRIATLRASIAGGRPYHAPPTPIWVPDRDLSPEMQHYLLGLLSLRLGETAAARRYLDSLTAVRDPKRQGPARDLARTLRAELARARGDLSGALEELEGFPFDMSNPGPHSLARWGVRERFLHGELLHALGRDEEALAWYDSFVGPYDLPYLAPAHLRRAQIYKKLGNAERARFHYRRFLALWKNCDPEFRVLVQNAQVEFEQS
ncbi:MAG TPA: BTAD domain-containing putative transcriptional regulator [Gemmatimonadales bacterium]|nr:BTAD domain-containing putative transcriptional regulator [Gemmatimonadales bacterium]